MFFILSKILLILIQPYFWVFVLLLWAAVTQNTKHKKRLCFTSLAVIYIFSNVYIIRMVMRAWDVPSQKTGNTRYSCAIVLGGFTSVDDEGNGFFNGASVRFISAVQLQVTGKVSKLLISGGSGVLLRKGDLKEADYTTSQLRMLHVPDSVILTENQSRNTMENALFSKKILQDKKIPGPYLLVTSAFHMRRALYTFKKAGLDVVPYSSDYAAFSTKFYITDLIPDVSALDTWNGYAKEMVGYITYHLKKFN